MLLAISVAATIVFQDLVNGIIVPIKGVTATYRTSHSGNVTVCISAHNRILFISEGEPYVIYIQDETVIGPANYNAEIIKVGANVTSTKQQGPVVFNGGSVALKANTIVLDSGSTIEKGTDFKVINK